MWHKNIAQECGTGMLNKPSEIEEIFVPNAPCLKKARKQLHPIQNFPFEKSNRQTNLLVLMRGVGLMLMRGVGSL